MVGDRERCGRGGGWRQRRMELGGDKKLLRAEPGFKKRRQLSEQELAMGAAELGH